MNVNDMLIVVGFLFVCLFQVSVRGGAWDVET